MAAQYVQFRYIYCSKKIAGPLVAIIGLLISIWTSCILIVMCYNDKYIGSYYYEQNGYDNGYYNDNRDYNNNIRRLNQLIVRSGQSSHILIAISVTMGLLWGLKKDDRVFLKPWILAKFLEVIVLFVGSIMLAIQDRQKYIGLMPVDIICLMVNSYLVLSMWDTCKTMPQQPVAPAVMNPTIKPSTQTPTLLSGVL